MVRIFVSPSHLCTLYMILYARATRKEGYKDVLILDSPPKKKSLKTLIKGTQKFYSWHSIIDLSPDLDDSVELVADTRKKLTRKLKSKPGFKQVYDILLRRHNKKLRAAEAALLSEQLAGLGEVIEINVLTQTLVNDALFALYPKAQVNYFEHGLGDYYHIQKIKPKHGFYCVFADAFKRMLEEKGSESSYVKRLPDLDKFPALAQEVLRAEDSAALAQARIDGKMVLVIGEAMQLYHVADKYYTDFIDLSLKQIKDPQNYTFVLKPHPSQTHKSLTNQEAQLEKHNLKTIVLKGGQLSNFSVEVLFSLWKDQTDYFISNFSSSGFYGSVLYEDCPTKFLYSYEFFLNYMQNAPQEFKNAYAGTEEAIKKVFGTKCVPMQL